VSPSDAEKMDLLPGDRIKVLSATGQIERTIQINSQIHPGFLHIPTAFNSNDARCLIRLMPLTDAHSSGWDWCQVAVAKADREKIEK
jgi:anaerobic selenocysteine-containing dehydrogenase